MANRSFKIALSFTISGVACWITFPWALKTACLLGFAACQFVAVDPPSLLFRPLYLMTAPIFFNLWLFLVSIPLRKASGSSDGRSL